MSEPSTRAGAGALQVAVLAPRARDAAVLAEALEHWGEAARPVEDIAALVEALERGEAEAALLTGEALTGAAVEALRDWTGARPAWDRLPVTVLAGGRGNTPDALARIAEALPQVELLVLQRPLREAELASAIRSMRRSRERQYALRDHLERQDRLRRELNHRVKNILATVQAVYMLSSRHAANEAAFHETYRTRLEAMARLHDVLFAGEYGAAPLQDVMRSVLAPYGAGTPDGAVEIDGDAIAASPDAAQSLGLVVHELVTNAAKYGALSDPAGRARLSWRAEGSEFVLDWAEQGGPPAAEPASTGYGTRFVDATVKQMDGTIERRFEETGLWVRIRLALALLGTQRKGR